MHLIQKTQPRFLGHIIAYHRIASNPSPSSAQPSFPIFCTSTVKQGFILHRIIIANDPSHLTLPILLDVEAETLLYMVSLAETPPSASLVHADAAHNAQLAQPNLGLH